MMHHIIETRTITRSIKCPNHTVSDTSIIACSDIAEFSCKKDMTKEILIIRSTIQTSKMLWMLFPTYQITPCCNLVSYSNLFAVGLIKHKTIIDEHPLLKKSWLHPCLATHYKSHMLQSSKFI